MAVLNLEKIKNLRKEKKLSQEELAELLGFKSIYSYNRKELGHVKFSADELHALANFFKVPSEYFFDQNVAKIATKEKEKEVI